MTAAAALLYALDPKWNEQKEKSGYRAILSEFCGLTDEGQIERILKYAERIGKGDFAV